MYPLLPPRGGAPSAICDVLEGAKTSACAVAHKCVLGQSEGFVLAVNWTSLWRKQSAVFFPLMQYFPYGTTRGKQKFRGKLVPRSPKSFITHSLRLVLLIANFVDQNAKVGMNVHGELLNNAKTLCGP